MKSSAYVIDGWRCQKQRHDSVLGDDEVLEKISAV